MKRLIILAFIALACAPKQEVKWPEPGFTDASRDPLKTFVFDSTLAFETLSATEIVTLDLARLDYFEAVKDSFPHVDFALAVYGDRMRSWLYHTYDSLEAWGKRPEVYYEYLVDLHWVYFFKKYGRDISSSPVPLPMPNSIDSRTDGLFRASMGLTGSRPKPGEEDIGVIPKPPSWRPWRR